jgi:hypothetical protein
MAKIGIITFNNTLDNYGQVLQYLAIQEYLKGRGHEAHLIIAGKKPTKFRAFLRYLKKVYRVVQMATHKDAACSTYKKWEKWSLRNDLIHPRKFYSFKKNFCNLEYLHNLQYDKGSFDAFAVGSDQIWSALTPFSYLAFAQYGELKFSIAPSIGKMVVDDSVVSVVKDWLADFKFITCREQSAVDMCRKAGRCDAQLILDPTFLISKDVYLQYSSSKVQNGDYIFVYMLGADISVTISQIQEFAKEEHLKVMYVASQGREDKYPKTWATIPEWLSLLANAKYVFTNSFHGMALSCIFQKQFMTFPIVGEMKGMNERIFNLAKEFNCESRIYTDRLDAVKDEIDYTGIVNRIKENRYTLDRLMKSINY